MGSFKSPLRIEDNSDGTFTLIEGFEYHIGELGSNIIIHVPKGFKTDFASIPNVLTSLIPKMGQHNKAAVIHDFLYQLVREGKFSRVVADAIFLECMGVLGVRCTRRWVIYLGVRIFGGLTIKYTKSMQNSP